MTHLRPIGTLVAVLLCAGAWQGAWAEPTGAGAKKPEPPTCDRAAFRVFVDVGHTAEVPGATSARGFKEYDFNLRLATLIEQQLMAAGFGKTVLLRSEEHTSELQ